MAAAEGDRAWAAVPMGAGPLRGALSLRFETERTFDAEEREFLLAVARQWPTVTHRWPESSHCAREPPVQLHSA